MRLTPVSISKFFLNAILAGIVVIFYFIQEDFALFLGILLLVLSVVISERIAKYNYGLAGAVSMVWMYMFTFFYVLPSCHWLTKSLYLRDHLKTPGTADLLVAILVLAWSFVLSMIFFWALAGKKYTNSDSMESIRMGIESTPRVFNLSLLLLNLNILVTILFFMSGDIGRISGNKSDITYIYNILVDPTACLIILISYKYRLWFKGVGLQRKYSFLYYISISMFVVMRMITGSKAALFDVIIILFGAALVFSGNKVLTKSTFLFVCILMLILPATFFVGYATKYVALGAAHVSITEYIDIVVNSSAQWDDLSIIDPILERVDALDVFVASLYHDFDILGMISHDALGFVNLIVPGEPFPGYITVSRALLPALGIQDINEASERYHTEPH